MRESKNPTLDTKIGKLIDKGYSTSKIVALHPEATRYRIQEVRYGKRTPDITHYENESEPSYIGLYAVLFFVMLAITYYIIR